MPSQLTYTEIIDRLRTKSNTSSKPFTHKICHHIPGEEVTYGNPDLYQEGGLKMKLKQFLDETYKDQASPGLYITGVQLWPQILKDHPEIQYYASIGSEIDDKEQAELNEKQTFAPGTAEGFSIKDWDQRAAYGSNVPSEENVQPIVDYLKKWYEKGTPSMLVRCAQGQYRSAVIALAAHSMISGNPAISATLLVLAGRGKIDSNWEIARIADPMLGFDGKLYSAALNIQRAKDKRDGLIRSEASLEVILDDLLALFLEPWDFDQACSYDKKKSEVF